MYDQLGRNLSITNPINRVVCLVPSLSELLMDLGLDSKLVGVTKFCVHPQDLRGSNVVVGGTKSIHLDKIAALNPDLIIANKEENSQEIVASCASLAPVYVSDINNFDEFKIFLKDLGILFNIKDRTDALMRNFQNRVDSFRSNHKSLPPRKVAYLIWKNPLMAAGGDNFINVILNELHLNNIFENKAGRYPEVTESELNDADLIFLSSEPFPFSEKHIQEFKDVTNTKILLVDGEFFSWYGSRLLLAFDYFDLLLNDLK